MKLEIIGIITYLVPLTVSLLGAVSIFGNKHKGVARNLLSLTLVILTYKFAYDILGVLDLDILQLIAFNAGNLLWFVAPPMLYYFYISLQTHNYELDKPAFRKHLITGGVIFTFSMLILGLLPIEQYMEVLNFRFQDSPTFEHNFYRFALFSLGTPLLFLQWFFYYFLLDRLIKEQQTYYGKFYGSYEKRNEQLMRRTFHFLIAIFAMSFGVQFMQITNPIYIILINLIQGTLLYFVISAGREQIDIKSYRMYKLSSHEEEIKNNKVVNEL